LQSRRLDESVRCANFAGAPPADAAWAVRLLAGRGLGRLLHADGVRIGLSRRWRRTLVVRHQSRGETATSRQTIAHSLPAAPCAGSMPLSQWIEDRLLALPRWFMPRACEQALQWCATLDAAGRELLLRLMLGRWRAVVDEPLLLQALAQHAGVDIRLLRLRWSVWMASSRRPDASPLATLLRRPTAASTQFASVRRARSTRTLSFAELAGGRAAWVRHRRHRWRATRTARNRGVAVVVVGELLNGAARILAARGACR
jgi:hypothetical protein